MVIRRVTIISKRRRRMMHTVPLDVGATAVMEDDDKN